MTGDLSGVEAAARALNRTVDGLTAEGLAAPSLLTGWTRAHVVAHVALNGFALARALDAVAHGQPATMYASDEDRDQEIEELAAAAPDDLRDRLLAATTEFADAVAGMPEDHWDRTFDRLPGGPTWPVATVLPTRRRELEIHHADLGSRYTQEDWPDDFVVELLDVVSRDQAASGPFRIHATDLDRSWIVGGDDGPLVTGRGCDLGWWLAGRGGGEGLSCDAGALPRLGPWRRAPATAAPTPEK